MSQRKQDKKQTIEQEQMFQKEQTIIYQGEEALVLDTEPVFTILIKKPTVFCVGIHY